MFWGKIHKGVKYDFWGKKFWFFVNFFHPETSILPLSRILFHWSKMKKNTPQKIISLISAKNRVLPRLCPTKCQRVQNKVRGVHWTRSNMWSKKVFQRVNYHVLDLLRRCNFSSEFYIESGSKLHTRTIWKWIKIAIWHVIWTKSALSERKRLYFYSKFMIMCQNAVLINFQNVRMCNFGPDSK